MSDEFEKWKFCSECNYAISTLEWDMVKFDYDCPNCEQCKLSMFYSYGSKTHLDKIDSWNNRWFDFDNYIKPLPYKE